MNASYNRLQSLPAEVGYLSNLKVLDLVGNFLMYLPISMSNLTGVRAIWLSANQNVPLIPFTEVNHQSCLLAVSVGCIGAKV